MMNYIAFDTETTGTEAGSRMIELAAILFDETGAILNTFERMANPGMPLPEDAAAVNGLTAEMLADKPDAGEVLREFFAWLPDKLLMAHYACFDTGIVSWEAERFGLQIPEGLMVIDTCEIAKAIKETKNNKLVTLAEHYSLVKNGGAHRAMCDADLCRQYFLLSRNRGMPESPLPWHQAGHDCSYTAIFPPHLDALPELVTTAGKLEFSYQDAKGDITDRSITPYGWAMTPTGLAFHGLCHMRKERRSFKADRIILKPQTKGI